MISINTQLIKLLPERILWWFEWFNSSLPFKTQLKSHASFYKIIWLVSFYSTNRPKVPREVTRDHPCLVILACPFYPHPCAIAVFTYAQANQLIISGKKLPLPKQLAPNEPGVKTPRGVGWWMCRITRENLQFGTYLAVMCKLKILNTFNLI